MRTDQPFSRALWVILYCLLHLVIASEDDLADFDFTDLKEIEWNYNTEQIGSLPYNAVEQNSIQSLVSFDDSSDENQVRPFDWRENVLKNALSKALTNASLRQKFVEVMPILRVLSSQQRLALSALISAQINVKSDHELKLDQVRMMFGDDKKLLLPIVYDIANLVRNSARKYLEFNVDIPSAKLKQLKQQTIIDRRVDDFSSAELAEEEKDRVSIAEDQDNNDLSLEDFFSESGEEMLDPLSINEELQDINNKSTETMTKPATSMQTNQRLITPIDESAKRAKRAVSTPEFVHKLIRSVPLSVDEDDIRRGVAGSTVKLNTSGFLTSKDFTTNRFTSNTNTTITPLTFKEILPTTGSQLESSHSYQEVEDLAFASLNGTVVDLKDSTDSPMEANALDEPLPSPEELIAGPRYRITSKMHQNRPKPLSTKRKRVQVSRMRSKAQINSGGGGNGVAPPKKCERFTSSMCIRTEDYPLDLIMGSIRRHKNAMTALWADYHYKSAQLDVTEDFDDITIRRREDDVTGGGMCQSIVRYARPQKARSASGEWKYIVNTGQHTQTLRLEKCTAPHESCSYLARNYRSHCAQVYNYHRLLSWDKTRGLHVDIFKVPTCCSCQVDGFRQQFPPLSGSKTKDFTPALNADLYSTIKEELDYNDEQDEDDLSYRFSNAFKGKYKKRDSGYDNNELLLGSQSVRSKLHSPNPTLGSYLSPPGDEEEYDAFDYKQQQEQHPLQHFGSPLTVPSSSAGKNGIRESSRRRPYKSLGATNIYNEARVDLDFSPSELHPEKEVNISGGSLAKPNKRVPQKRQRIHSVPHTVSVNIPSTAAAVASATISSLPSNNHLATRFTTPPTTIGTRGVIGNRGGIASNAHQASASSSIYHGTLQKQTNFSNNVNGVYRNRKFTSTTGKKSRPRFRSAVATTTAISDTATNSRATPAPTESNNQWRVFQNQQSAPPQPPRFNTYHVNSIYSPEYNATNVDSYTDSGVRDKEETIRTSSGLSPKRINYSYHPIIDFFENHKYSTAETTTRTLGGYKDEFDNNEAEIYPHTITKSQVLTEPKAYDLHKSHERRIGYGVNSGDGRSGTVMRDRVDSSVGPVSNYHTNTDDHIWHPVIIKTEEFS